MNTPLPTLDDAWIRLRGEFRRVCLLRREGRQQEAGRLLAEELPRRIAEWSRLSPETAAHKRVELESMMRDEQRRVDDAWMVQHLVVQRVTEEVVPALIEAIAHEVQAVLSGPAAQRRAKPILTPGRSGAVAGRVRLDDVEGMIDAVLDQEARRAPALQPV